MIHPPGGACLLRGNSLYTHSSPQHTINARNGKFAFRVIFSFRAFSVNRGRLLVLNKARIGTCPNRGDSSKQFDLKSKYSVYKDLISNASLFLISNAITPGALSAFQMRKLRKSPKRRGSGEKWEKAQPPQK